MSSSGDPVIRAGPVRYVHPFDSYPDPADTTKALTDELAVDVALDRLISGVDASRDWNTDREKQESQDLLARARVVFGQRAEW